MPVSLALLMAFTAAVLTLSVCAVLWRKRESGTPASADEAAPAAVATPVPAIPSYAPPAGSLLAAQLEVDQTFYVQTQTAKYVLKLRDPVHGEYEALRVGPKLSGGIVEERFTMFFAGTFVPHHGLRFGEFVLGGNLSYKKLRDGAVLDIGLSSRIVRIFFSIPEICRQAS